MKLMSVRSSSCNGGDEYLTIKDYVVFDSIIDNKRFIRHFSSISNKAEQSLLSPAIPRFQENAGNFYCVIVGVRQRQPSINAFIGRYYDDEEVER
jgi:hypothetical protein